ncbi:MAG: 4-hydroxy 2-oxovalerate aldolase [Actinomycetota bacterium]|jgi:4-hydroxy 2-oxovalerate aldolase
MTGEITVLDCTLRDGGYYTNWQFDQDVVNRYLQSVAAAGVDVIELGFRTPDAKQFLGPYAHTTDWLLESLDLPDCRLGVMLNVADFVGDERAGVDRVFKPADQSRISVVRLATHLRDIDSCTPLAERLRELGYFVGVNLMQTGSHPVEAVQDVAATLQRCEAIGVLYFADSLGNMDADDVRTTVRHLRDVWDRPLGIHTHDNRRLALSNSIAAVEAGVEWVDATIRGMGRGPGNAQTEFLLAELARTASLKYSPDPLVRTVMEDFAALQAEHGWGANLLYLKAADYGVHPTYVQTLQSDSRYELADIVSAIEALRFAGGHSYSADGLATAIDSGEQHPDGTWDPEGWLAGREVLILAASPKAEDHREAIERFASHNQLPVLCLNSTPPIDASMVTAYVACHPVRLALEAGRIARLDRPLVAPRTMIDAVGIGTPDGEDLRDYGVVVEPGRFEAGEHSCIIPSRLAMAYALAISLRAGATRILVAGVDGYGPGDARQEQMQELLDLYAEGEGRPPIVAITPTTYRMPQSSVYAADV